jgi:NADH-quinone oxidoreductase subunit N
MSAVVSMPDIRLSLLAPELFVAVAALVLLLLGAWASDEKGRQRVGQFALSAVAFVAVMLLVDLTGIASPVTTFAGAFVVDQVAVFFKLFMVAATLFPLMLSWEFLRARNMDGGEYFVLTLFALLGGMVIASSGDFMALYLGIELMSLSVYVLAAYRRDDPASNEAGLKYFILGSMASGLLLYGISLVYGVTGTTSFAAIHHVLSAGHVGNGLALNIGVLMVLAGLFFKIAAAPFHMWAPDVYQGAPTSVTAFMSVMPKLAGFVAFYRVLVDAFAPLSPKWGFVLQVVAVLSMAVGAIAAIAQTDIKRMLAYSSIGHAGYALIGFAVANEAGYQSVLVYLAIYVFMNLGAFAVIVALDRSGMGVGEKLDDYRGLAQKHPLLAFLMALFMFSMAGIPPLAGFIGKLGIFMAAVNAGMMTLAILGVLASAIGAFYYLRIVKLMYFDTAEQEFVMPVGGMSRVVIAVSTVVVLFWGVLPDSLLQWAERSVRLLSSAG